ncbi:hypothetical protein Tco_1040262 [Tanacetum coccineum]
MLNKKLQTDYWNEMCYQLHKFMSFALRNFDLEDMEFESTNSNTTAKLPILKLGDDIAIYAIPLATKPPVIVEYKLLKEGIMVHYQLIRADGSSKRYSSMIRMLQGISQDKAW